MVTRQLLDSVQFLPKLEQELPNTSFCEWISFTPTVIAGTGALTSATASMVYNINEAKLVTFQATVVITTNGTGSNFIRISLPFPVKTGIYFEGSGRIASIGTLLNIELDGSNGTITGEAGVYPGGNGRTLRLSGFYQAN